MKIAFLFSLALIWSHSTPAQADPWANCEKALHFIPTELYRIVGSVDRAEGEEMDQIQTTVLLPKDLHCPSDVRFVDMPSSLQRFVIGHLEDLGVRKPEKSLSEFSAAQALEFIRQKEQKMIDEKLHATITAKVTGRLSMVRQEKEEVQEELSRRKRVPAKN